MLSVPTEPNSPQISPFNASLLTGGGIERLAEFFAGSKLLRHLEDHPITLLNTNSTLPLDEVEGRAISAAQPIFVCDVPIAGFEKIAKLQPYGLVAGRVTNLDHHFDLDEMRCYVSTGNLVIKYVLEHDALTGDALVIINHKDCDSILSALMLRGALPPDARFGQAVLDADHRGAENPISDLLQSLQVWGKGLPPWERLAFSVRNLELLIEGKELHPEAAAALANRRLQRELAKQFVADGKFTLRGDLAFATSDSKIDPELFLPFLPDAKVIMFSYPLTNDPSRYEIRLRLGLNPRPGMSLLHLGINEFDPGFGGRWNAGSNRRNGGTAILPDAYANSLSERLAR